MDIVLSVKNLSFSYVSTDVLSDVSFDVNRGDYVALAGPNGAGKTTLIKSILGLAGKYQGSVEILGKKFEEFKDWEKIGYLPQRVNSFNPLFPATVSEVVGLGLLSSKRYPKKINSKDKIKIKEILDLMDIYDLRDTQVGNLSGGQQQRVFLARALISSPEILFLDEPSTALDQQTRQNFFDVIEKLNKEKKVTIILITHDTSQVGHFSNKLLYLDKSVVFYNSFSDFCNSPNMEKYFGHFSQHLICHQHHDIS